MRLVRSLVSRAPIDAEIRAARYPNHDPARWALPLVDALDRLATGWQVVELDEATFAALWLPAHEGEPCHGDSMRLGDDPAGQPVRSAIEWLDVHRDAYASANPSCWGRITHAATASSAAPIVVSPVNVGDRVMPPHAALVVVDGLHRAVGYALAGRRTCLAYVPMVEGE
ncbi:MAG: hypothetical protein IT182_00645 [Acidobacteria bacterium]|nr:hypothetical protein [Acidobacteriota bacterium]